MRSQKGPLLIRRLSGCTIKACLAPPSLGGNACKTPCKCCMVTLHPVKRLRKGCMVVSHPVKRSSKCCLVVSHTVKRSSKCCIVTPHTATMLCRCCIVTLHTVKGLCRCCIVVSHTVKGLRRCCMVISHTVEGLRRCCTLVSHTAPACARGERRFTPPLRGSLRALLQQFADCATERGVDDRGGDLCERLEDEASQVHQWVGQG